MNEEMYECCVWLFDEDDDRLARLMDRMKLSRSAVVREALKMLEIRLNMYESCGIIVDDIKEE